MQVQSAGELAVASRSQEIVSVASQGVASRVTVASRFVNPKHDELLPAVIKEFYQLHRRYGYRKCQKIGSFLHSFIVLYFVHNYIHTYRIVE